MKASSLTEIIVATSILLIVFAIAIVTLNNLMVSSIQKDTQNLDVKIEKLIYQYQNKQLEIPLSYQEGGYSIQIKNVILNDIKCIEFSIQDINKGKSKVKRIITNIYNER
ncbi:hypothetical protein [Polaribacter sp. Asnod6-C07]|uniref:hypothetical protein n=1 Tax=Polaribacter sp. Asnod6-C07 TaxID=3160582 RepID=UPI0038698037